MILDVTGKFTTAQIPAKQFTRFRHLKISCQRQEIDNPQQSSRCNLNIEKVVHFVLKESNNHLGLVHYFQTTNEIFGKRNQHLSIPSYCEQSEINKVMMYISRLIQIMDRKCQFHVFDN